MDEIYYNITTEQRLEVISGLQKIFDEIDNGKINSVEAFAKLRNFSNSFEDEELREYCNLVIQTVIMRRLDEQNSVN